MNGVPPKKTPSDKVSSSGDGPSEGEGAAEGRRPTDDGAEADESGYPRDDYWREESPAEGIAPDDVPEPPQGYSFESPEEKADADDGTTRSSDERRSGSGGHESGQDGQEGRGQGCTTDEQGNAGGRDDARIVDD